MPHEKTLKEQVYAWLNSQGYPLEMTVASSLRNSGFGVQHSSYYIDPETSKSREIDVICNIHDQYGMADIYYVIECKATSKPWIVFSAEYARENLNILASLAVISEKTHEFITDNAQTLYDSLAWVTRRGRIGYSITQAFSEGHDVPYEAILSAVKASVWLYNSNESQGSWKIPFFFAFPVIFTTSPLFECYLDNGVVTLQEISESTLYFDGKFGNLSGVCVRVINESSLTNFQKTISKMSEYILTLLKEDIEKEWILWQQRVANAPRTNGA